MGISDTDRELLIAALERLNSDEVEAFPLSTLVKIMDRTWVERIKERRSEYIEINRQMTHVQSMLSSEAQDWWKEAKQTLAYGRLVLSGKGRKAEKALSRMCEELDASFPSRVMPHERGFFKIHKLEDGAGWDDRWHYCIDHNFPLLREMAHAPAYSDPMREAQISIIQETLDEKAITR